MPEYPIKRIERPLLVQTRTDKYAIVRARKVLEDALADLDKELEKNSEEYLLTVQKRDYQDRVFVNSAANAAYDAARDHIEEVLLKNPEFVKEWTIGSNKGEKFVDHMIVRDIAAGMLRPVWNEAIELAAQVTGGAAGTLIRDLKED